MLAAVLGLLELNQEKSRKPAALTGVYNHWHRKKMHVPEETTEYYSLQPWGKTAFLYKIQNHKTVKGNVVKVKKTNLFKAKIQKKYL